VAYRARRDSTPGPLGRCPSGAPIPLCPVAWPRGGGGFAGLLNLGRQGPGPPLFVGALGDDVESRQCRVGVGRDRPCSPESNARFSAKSEICASAASSRFVRLSFFSGVKCASLMSRQDVARISGHASTCTRLCSFRVPGVLLCKHCTKVEPAGECEALGDRSCTRKGFYRMKVAMPVFNHSVLPRSTSCRCLRVRACCCVRQLACRCSFGY
jgi:hypothetical protein